MHFPVDPSRPEPLYEQVVEGVRGAIAAGELRPGDEVPSVRVLAAELGLNYHTVARALRQVEEQGWIERQRGGAYRVALGADIPAVEELLRAEVARLCDRALALGVGADALLAMVGQTLAERAQAAG